MAPPLKKIILECDLSQAEGRVVYVRSRDAKLIELARTRPDEFDMHTHNASVIFGCEPKLVTKEQRYLGKKTVHGAQRGLGGEKMAGELLKDGHVISAWECSKFLRAYLNDTGLDRSYMPEVRKRLLQDRVLINAWGRRWSVKYERMNEDLYRRGYSWYPQSDVADLLNQRGFLPLSRFIRREGLQARINLQVHDSLVISTPPNEAYTIARFLRDSLETPIDYEGIPLAMPVEVKLGRTWKGDVEFKKLPKRAAFTEIAHAIAAGEPIAQAA